MNSLERCVSDAQALFRSSIRRVQADRLMAASTSDSWARRSLSDYSQVRVVGMGKAAMAMAGVVEAEHVEQEVDGTVVVPEGYPAAVPEDLPLPSGIEVQTGGHPLPTEGSVRAARRLLEHAEEGGENDLLLVLVSGGGTALSSLPVDALDLPDLRATYHLLLQGGVPIGPANAVRKHLTQLGGGQLAQAAAPADVAGLVVSDVVGDDLSTIASGPTVPDPTTYEDALQALYQYGLWHDVPQSVRDHLAAGARGRIPETPTAEASCFEQAQTTLLGTNNMALVAAQEAATARGYEVRSLTPEVTGEARAVGRRHAAALLSEPVERPTCWLWGGEPTVTVTGEGVGGRNQEVALGAALELEGRDARAVLLSGGTDGIDGPTDAAGAWATPSTCADARAEGLDPNAHLDENDSYPFFDRLDQLLRLGPTHTNVMDIHIGLVRPSP